MTTLPDIVSLKMSSRAREALLSTLGHRSQVTRGELNYIRYVGPRTAAKLIKAGLVADCPPAELIKTSRPRAG